MFHLFKLLPGILELFDLGLVLVADIEPLLFILEFLEPLLLLLLLLGELGQPLPLPLLFLLLPLLLLEDLLLPVQLLLLLPLFFQGLQRQECRRCWLLLALLSGLFGGLHDGLDRDSLTDFLGFLLLGGCGCLTLFLALLSELLQLVFGQLGLGLVGGGLLVFALGFRGLLRFLLHGGLFGLFLCLHCSGDYIIQFL